MAKELHRETLGDVVPLEKRGPGVAQGVEIRVSAGRVTIRNAHLFRISTQAARARYAQARAEASSQRERATGAETSTNERVVVLGALFKLHAASSNLPELLRLSSRAIADGVNDEVLVKVQDVCPVSTKLGGDPAAFQHQRRRALEFCLLTQPINARQRLLAINTELKSDVLVVLPDGWTREIRRSIEGLKFNFARPVSKIASQASGEEDRLAEEGFERSLKDLVAVDASGFDAGRLDGGIDQLADEYAKARDAWVRAGKPAGAAPMSLGKSDASTKPRDLRQESESAFSRLQHMVTDLASRMQFLATNLFLVGEPNESTSELAGTKGTLEAIANTILVHADDLQRQRQFDDVQRGSAERERRAASSALQPDPTGAVQGLMETLDRRIASAQQAASAAASSDEVIVKLKAEIEDLKKKTNPDDPVFKALVDVNAQGNALAQLLSLPGFAKPAGLSRDEVKAVQSEGSEMIAALRKGNGAASLESLRAALATDMAARVENYSAPARKDLPQAKVLQRARTYLDTQLKPMTTTIGAAGTRAKSVDAFNSAVLEAVLAGQARLSTLQSERSKQQEDAKEKQGKLDTLTRTFGGETLNLPELRDVRERAQIVRSQVLLKATQARADAAGVRTLFSTALREEAAKKSGEPKDKFERAAKEIDALPLSAALETPREGSTAKDVQDDLIAQLRYAWIESLRQFGPGSQKTQFAEAALEKARRQREDTIYVRPASTYLRSALPITALQDSTRLTWTNMLLQDATRSPLEFWSYITGNDRGADDRAKADLDKAHWQNINTVRVSGAGSTNFAIAKDDVGNWYVKAMGSDPVAMANAARRLALFNAGVKYDTNLVRIDELRNEVDERRKKGDNTAAQEKEIGDLRGGSSGPAVAARSDTLALFTKNYQDQSVQQLNGLASQLQAEAPLKELQKRFTAVMANSPAPAALDDIVSREQVRDLYGAATDIAQAEGASAKPGNTIIDVLQSLKRLQAAVKAAVAGEAKVTATEIARVDVLKGEAAVLRTTLGIRATEEEGKVKLLDEAKVEFEKPVGPTWTESQRRDAATRFDDARRSYAATLTLRRDAEAALKKKQDEQVTADKALFAAQARQTQAGTEADAVFKKLIDDVVAERLRVVIETETAVKIIGGNKP